MAQLGWAWVESCRAVGGVPTLELFDEAVAAGEGAIPLMGRILSRRSWRTGRDPDQAAISVGALRVLGAIESPRAVPIVLGVLRDPIDVGLFGEEAAHALGRIGESALATLERVLADRGEDAWVRGAAARALTIAALRDRRLRPAVLPAFERVLRDREQTDRLANALVVHAIRMLAADDLLGAIDEAYRAGRVDDDFIAWDDLLLDLVARRHRPDPEEKAAARRDVREDYVSTERLLAGMDPELGESIAGELERLRRDGAQEPAEEDEDGEASEGE